MYKVDFYMAGRKEPLTVHMTEDELEHTQRIELRGWIIVNDVLINRENLDAIVMEKLE